MHSREVVARAVLSSSFSVCRDQFLSGHRGKVLVEILVLPRRGDEGEGHVELLHGRKFKYEMAVEGCAAFTAYGVREEKVRYLFSKAFDASVSLGARFRA